MNSAPTKRLLAILTAFTTLALLPGWSSATHSQTSLQFGCALKSNGLVRYVTSTNDCKTKQETPVTFWPGPTYLCIKPEGSVRLGNNPSDCGSGPPSNRGTLLTVPASAPSYFCAAADTGVLRYVTDPTACASGETALVIGNHNPTDIALSPSSVPENQPIGTVVGTLSASDPDPAASFTFSLIAGAGSDDNTSFSIAGTTLTTTATFDFETKNSYSIRVRVTDGLGGTYEEVLTISVTNIVENSPPTDVALSNATIAENQAAGGVVGTLSTTDPTPADTHTYSFVTGAGSTDNAKFQISGSTLRTDAVLDFEALSILSVRIGTTDSAGGSFEKSFSITVTNTNDAPTDIALSNASVSEASAIGTTVGTFVATDQDVADTPVFTLVAGTGDANNAKFQIVGNALKTNSVLDFETAPSLTVRVRADDGNGGNFEKAFTITVTDAAENSPPNDITLTPASIAENQPIATTVGTLAAVDVDAGQTHTFSLQPTGCGGSFPDSTSFAVVGTALKTAASFNFEVKSSFAACLRASDNGSPVQSFDKIVTITVTNQNDPPSAVQDDYSGAIGNTLAVLGVAGTGPHVILTGNVLLQNDTDEDVPAQPLSAVAATVLTTGGGSVTIATNGSFSYLPGVGDKNLSNDTFTYQVTDGIATTSGTATVDVANALVWYANSALGSNGDGRSNSPFNTLASLQGTDPDGTGDLIFLYEGTFAGGLVLENDQQLLGQPEGLVVNNGFGNVTLVTAGGTNPTITNAGGNGITLAQANTIKRVNVASTSGDGIAGVGVNIATIGPNITISGTAGDGIDLSGGNGTIDVGAAVQATTGEQIRVAGRTGGTTSFTGVIGGTGTGVILSANTGATISFSGGIALSTGSNEAFGAVGGGTVTITGAANTLLTTTGTALNVANTTIGAAGLTLRSVSSSGASGIVLNNTGSSGGLTVTGTGSAGTGGTIQNGATGISLTNTANPSFSWMQLNDHSDFAIRGSSVGGFNLTNSVINGTNGSDASADEGTVRFTELTGAATVTNSTISGGIENNFAVINTGGTLNRITVTGTTFGSMSAATGDHALLIESAGTATINSTISNNTFTAARGTHINRILNSTTSSDTVILGNNISNMGVTPVSAGGAAIRLVGGNNVGLSPSATFNIANNTMRDSLGTALAVNKLGGTGTFNGTITDNTVGLAAVANSGSAEGSGIFVLTDGAGSYTVTVTGNTVRQYGNFGISLQTGGSGVIGNGTMKAIVTSNTVSNPGTLTFAKHGVQLNAGVTVGDSYRVCLTLGGAGGANAITGTGTDSGTDFRLRQRQSTTVYLPGYAGANSDDAGVVAFVQGNNGGTPTGSALNTVPTGGGFQGNCPF